MSQFKVAVYLFPKADVLDFSGPVEMYSHTYEGTEEKMFSITSFAHHNPVQSASSPLVYIPDATFADISARIEDFDILVIPGAHFSTIADLIEAKEGKELSQLIQKFVQAKPRPETGKRILQSVCSGSVLLAASGVLAGRTITTHHMGLDMLKKVADDAAGGDSKVNVVRQRWVDAGTTEAGVRIVNAGGVTSGIDASLWILEQIHGKKVADHVAEVAEFERREAAWGISA
ncbi:DJ-1 domain -type [Pyrenophora seminiperda CCB06]|uniref:DJ-1 domain-type n=1 Tax=Pyrenophora seminiperda CCB06 TaxID=1302712 RepID=A0A3M7LVY5_9PLEO|nr:DJ-1 domain -type [Pyrenophora seminiperda CCB06]